MANPSVKKTPKDSLRGLSPALAEGSGVGDFGVVGANSAASMTISDPDIRAGMIIYAAIQQSPDNNWVIAKAVAGNGSVVITVINTDNTNATTGGNTTIAYFAR